MPASEYAFPPDKDGTPHPSTVGKSRITEPTHRRAQLSGEAHGDGDDHGFMALIEPPDRHPHDFDPDH
jgi:hypothetical protein